MGKKKKEKGAENSMEVDEEHEGNEEDESRRKRGKTMYNRRRISS